ncbi:ABC transporter ATP-binding protein [Methyloceanibacter caenitepidi]|uniref:Ferric iron ABC transporter, ATP-binding protein n=1 Tax=Methyloceanibacter caenitepidi TaxID=1384459 RepID=A0A0A8K425_9HYPH|nr:ABC transporter ATP-binding protein [Methyloceanibacter caenitepidi]BAQ17277.1 ferric iron ABC transporter, ATP-binding protein [Methyloceanibacter caenitepidi]
MLNVFKARAGGGANGPLRTGRGKAAVTFAARLGVDHVSRRYGQSFALKDVTLEVEPSKILCLLGPSGCGKTTLLRIIAGVEAPTSGVIRLEGDEVAGPDRFVPPEKRGVGLMFQDFALFPHLTILDNVAFGLRALTKQEARAEAHAALERVGLAHYENEYPHILSGGQQQRVALARAIAPRPGVILMDEPFSGLDSQLRESMREETLAIIRESRATCIVVTHDAEEAMRMGDVIALMREGRVVQMGPPLDLYRTPKDIFAARTFSDLNELPARVQGGRAETPLGTFAAPDFEDGTSVIVCVRQGGIRLLEAGQGTPGRVLDSRFLGDVGLLEIAVDGVAAPVLVRVREADMPVRGTELGVGVDESAVLIFAGQDD